MQLESTPLKELHKIVAYNYLHNDFAIFARGIGHWIECVETREKLHENFEQLS